VKYAQDHKLSIFVDWSDSIWHENFYKYFSLDMPTMNLDDIGELSVHPPFWQGRLKDTLTDEINGNTSAAIGRLEGIYPADVIVVTCNGLRTIFSDSIFFNVFQIIDQRVLQEVRRRQEVYKLNQCWGIHLRGNDRASDIEYKTKRISELGVKLVANGFFSKKAVVVSDDEDYIRLWKQRWDHPVLTQGGQFHREANSNKDTLNVNLLIDFLTLASCSRVFTTARDSRFAREAQKFQNIKRIV